MQAQIRAPDGTILHELAYAKCFGLFEDFAWHPEFCGLVPLLTDITCMLDLVPSLKMVIGCDGLQLADPGA